MTYTATATYFPIQAVVPIQFGACQANSLDDAIAILMDDIREFMRREESNNWWDDVTITVHHDHVITNYAFQHWAKKFAWSF